MKKYIYTAIAILSMSFVMTDYTKKDFKKISIKIPKKFHQLNDNDMVTRFGIVSLPEAMYASTDNRVSITIVVKKDTLDRDGLTKLKLQEEIKKDINVEKSFKRSSLYHEFSKVNFITDTVYTNGKYEIIDLEFDSVLEGEDKKGQEIASHSYNYIKYVYYKKYTYIINFACPVDLRATWKPVANEIMDNVSYK